MSEHLLLCPMQQMGRNVMPQCSVSFKKTCMPQVHEKEDVELDVLNLKGREPEADLEKDQGHIITKGSLPDKKEARRQRRQAKSSAPAGKCFSCVICNKCCPCAWCYFHVKTAWKLLLACRS
jgi:hypothetical protein